jgi:hypothetical protein
MVGPGYQNVITTDLVDDPMLTASNIKTFKRAYKELYNYGMERRDNSFAYMRCRMACLNLLLYAKRDHALTEEIQEAESVVSGHQELAAKDKRVSEELMKNIYLRRELDKLKAKRTREIWLLKNDLRNLEKANSELREQLEGKKKAHQEQLKEQKKAHQGKPLLPSSTST